MKKGVYLAIAAAIISGVSIFVNAFFISKTDPFIFTIVRNAAVAVLLTGILLAGGFAQKLRLLSKKDWGKLMLIGAVGGGIPFALFFTGLSTIGAFNGNMIQKSLFLWVALLAVPLLKERISKVQLVGYVVLFIGMFVLGGTIRVVPSVGMWLILASTILWAIENIIAKVTLQTVPPIVVSWGRMMFGLPFLFAAAAVMGRLPLLLSPAAYTPMPIVVSSILLTVYVTTWYSALALAPATLVSSILVFAPVVTALLGSVILKKVIIGQQLTSLFLLTAGTVLVSSEKFLPKKQDLKQ